MPKDPIYMAGIFEKSRNFDKCHGQCSESEAIPYIQNQNASEFVKSLSAAMIYLIDLVELQEGVCYQENLQIASDYVLTADNKLQKTQLAVKALGFDEKTKDVEERLADIVFRGYALNEKLYEIVRTNNNSACNTAVNEADELENRVDSLLNELFERNLSLIY